MGVTHVSLRVDVTMNGCDTCVTQHAHSGHKGSAAVPAKLDVRGVLRDLSHPTVWGLIPTGGVLLPVATYTAVRTLHE
eukprot:1192003-Prorocentrum_minimum.AAC.1